ncbi:hypothetical protein G5I_12413 [Acromyrmex echinatior]|uniref:Uncharacterized protein n=1 Tax=Acromyrmex echinatior TaxID=103372 RepID=F4X291_ACREC|nr:hypothetical protein G5I_12413 [Acromyrmex echinatior]
MKRYYCPPFHGPDITNAFHVLELIRSVLQVMGSALSQSQFPVFTIYAQKSCLAVKPCERAWCIDRVQGHRLQGHARRTMTASSRQHCLELCLGERDFLCRCEKRQSIRHFSLTKHAEDDGMGRRGAARLPISIELGVARLCGITPTRQGSRP